jgi:hypothetical protein
MSYTTSLNHFVRKNRYCVIAIVLLSSCADDELKIDKSQLTLGIWQYEYKDNPLKKSTTLTFSNDGTYVREDVYLSLLSGTTSSTKEGTWAFTNDNVLDLTGFGTCVQLVGEPPCTPPDVDFKIFRLTKKILEVEEWVNGSPPLFPGKIQYINIKP